MQGIYFSHISLEAIRLEVVQSVAMYVHVVSLYHDMYPHRIVNVSTHHKTKRNFQRDLK